MEECRIADYIHIRMVLTELLQSFKGECLCLRLSHIECDLVFDVLPAVYDGIVHMHRIPDDECEEAYRIFMERLCFGNRDIPGLLTVCPAAWRDDFSCGSVDYFPSMSG